VITKCYSTIFKRVFISM